MIKELKQFSGEQFKTINVLVIGFLGVASLCYSIYQLLTAGFQQKMLMDSLIVIGLLAVTFSKSVTLPSGSYWRPSIGLIIYSAFVFPFHVAILIIFSGILISQSVTGTSLKTIWISLGHLMLGILAIRGAVVSFAPVFGYSLPPALAWMGLGLMGHFFINRLISAVIGSSMKKKKLLEQIKLIKKDLNWGYVSTYIVGACMVFMYQSYGSWGMLVAVPLLFSIYFSVLYFEKANKLKQISLTDALTGAENRASWEQFKEEFQVNGCQGTFGFVDLDHFKGINDRWGHDTGDRVLREAVSCLKQIWPSTSRVFRYGGDEFILFIPHHEADQLAVQQIIHKKIHEKNQEWLNQNYTVAISIGLKYASSNTTGLSLDEILIHLDKQMYRNKLVNKMQVF
ncbi:GGDEF domain-containing protein [Bacillus sp. BRMEA1]|uniref:GGDEF domain-containing protein n=1 Tax=Neobacillus endophyticus TaxID=2738405 RepID=UPI0015657A2E|nr:GGDEF domain-containing protein [Neobacillus endophyticus]NRD76770.1 GGDEF domain-containing protein [Neobacillus endophyticus]